jgi:hypothetical protein
MERSKPSTRTAEHNTAVGLSLDRILDLSDATLWVWLRAKHHRANLAEIDGLLEEVTSLVAWVRAEIGQDPCGVEVCQDVLLEARTLATAGPMSP